jgi:hypothetical protein
MPAGRIGQIRWEGSARGERGDAGVSPPPPRWVGEGLGVGGGSE